MLANALGRTGVAGQPEAYFRPNLRASYEKEWGLNADHGDDIFLASARSAGTSKNGLFGATVLWLEFQQLVAMLRDSAQPENESDQDLNQTEGQTDQRLLSDYLADIHYVHLVRRDKVGQAIEWYRSMRASQQVSRDGSRLPWSEVAFDFPTIDQLYQRLLTDEWKWVAHFGAAKIRPVVVTYESLRSDFIGTVSTVAEQLGIGGRDRIHIPTLDLRNQDDAPPNPGRDAYIHWRQNQVRHNHPHGPSVSIVVVSHNEGENLTRTIGALESTVPESVELLVVDDHSSDGSTAFLTNSDRVRAVKPPQRAGVAGARNYGAGCALGEILVFADAHVHPSPGWLELVCSAFRDKHVAAATPTISGAGRPNAKGFGFTWSRPDLVMSWIHKPPQDGFVPFICGCFMVFRRDDFDSVGGFDAGMLTWGSEDAEIGLNLWRRDRASVVVPAASVSHLFRPTAPYQVRWEWITHNTLRLATVHLGPEAQRQIVKHLATRKTFARAYEELLASDVWQRREAIRAASKHDGKWFLDKFQITCLA
jgi:GT2 family glycosyltransferase/LPS sulfotransferase NodH